MEISIHNRSLEFALGYSCPVGSFALTVFFLISNKRRTISRSVEKRSCNLSVYPVLHLQFKQVYTRASSCLKISSCGEVSKRGIINVRFCVYDCCGSHRFRHRVCWCCVTDHWLAG